MDRISDLFANNSSIALVCVISVKDRALILRESRPTLSGAVPHDAVVSAYLNIITSAALAFDADASSRSSGSGPSAASSAGGRTVLASPDRGTMANSMRSNNNGDESSSSNTIVEEEAWGLLRFRTPQWDISAFRQDSTSSSSTTAASSSAVEGQRGKASGAVGSSQQLPDQYIMVTFSDVQSSSSSYSAMPTK